MAHVIRQNAGGSPIYNVDEAVGGMAPNAPADVKLVQYLLTGIYHPADLAVDGRANAATTSWIRRFQEDSCGRGIKLKVDGRVDRAFGTATSRSPYTIVQMNYVLQSVDAVMFAALPSQVPISPYPKALPPKTGSKPNRQIDYVIYMGQTAPQSPNKVFLVFFTDGTKEQVVTPGNFTWTDKWGQTHTY